MAYPRTLDTVDASAASDSVNDDEKRMASKTDAATNANSNGYATNGHSPNGTTTAHHKEDAALDTDDEYGEDTLLWYFSYGSNMNPAIFEEKRKIQPLDHRVCKVPGRVLTYLESCLPYAEPAFCTCLARSRLPPDDPRPDIHGVAFLITRRQYEHVLMTEGGWGYQELRNDPFWSLGHYGEQAIECVEIAPQEGCCERMPKSIVPGRKFRARTLVGLSGLRERYDCHASQRYNDLVQDGAKSSGLPQAYQAYLQEFHPSFRPIQNSWKTTTAKTLYFLAALPFFIPEFQIAFFFNRRAEKQLLRWTEEYQRRRKEKEQETSDTTTASATKIKKPKRKPFEGVRRAPWIVLKLFHVFRTIWLELLVIPLLFTVCQCPCGWYNANDAPGDTTKASSLREEDAAADAVLVKASGIFPDWLDKLDEKVSEPLFALRLPSRWIELLVSLPANFFGTTACLSVGPLWIAWLAANDTEGERFRVWLLGLVTLLATVGYVVAWVWMQLKPDAYWLGPTLFWNKLGYALAYPWSISVLVGITHTGTSDQTSEDLRNTLSHALYPLVLFPPVLVVMNYVKAATKRRRPAAKDRALVWLSHKHFGANSRFLAQHSTLQSFPSGDVMMATLLAIPLWSLGYHLGAVLVVALSGLGRMFVLAHHALDVLAGAGCTLGLHGIGVRLLGYNFPHATQWWHPVAVLLCHALLERWTHRNLSAAIRTAANDSVFHKD